MFSGFTTATGESGMYLAIDGQPVMPPGVAQLGQAEAMPIKDKLDKLEGTPLGSDGDYYVIDENNNLAINIVAKPYQPEGFFLLKETPTGLPDGMIDSIHFGVSSMITLWGRAA